MIQKAAKGILPRITVAGLLLAESMAHAAHVPDEISAELGKFLRNCQVPALAAAAVFEGRIVSAGAAGYRKAGSDERVTVDDKFHIGSCTKSMTSVLAVIMVESGKLKWETTLAEVFPDVDLHEDYKATTLEQLLTNTGGVPGDVNPALWSDLWAATGPPEEQRMRLVRGILSQKPAYKPGSRQVYSNAGFSIAGAMIESVGGQAYEAMLTDRLFKPLKMESAGFRAPATPGAVNQPYGHSGSGVKFMAHDPEPRGDNPRAIAPAGAVHCSILDFARYASFHLGNTSANLISQKSMKRLHTPAKRTNYAMGWMVVERPWADGVAITHVGSNTMFHAVVWIAPQRNFAAVAMCNYGEQAGFEKCDEAIAFLIEKHL